MTIAEAVTTSIWIVLLQGKVTVKTLVTVLTNNVFLAITLTVVVTLEVIQSRSFHRAFTRTVKEREVYVNLDQNKNLAIVYRRILVDVSRVRWNKNKRPTETRKRL